MGSRRRSEPSDSVVRQRLAASVLVEADPNGRAPINTGGRRARLFAMACAYPGFELNSATHRVLDRWLSESPNNRSVTGRRPSVA